MAASLGIALSSDKRWHTPWADAAVRLLRSSELRLLTGLLMLATAIAVAGTKPLGVSVDLENYRDIFDWSINASWGELLAANDPGYHVLTKLLWSLGADFAAFSFVLAAVTCTANARVLALIEGNRRVLLLLYFSYLFWLHDYTQIRLGLALALALLGIYSRSRFSWLLYPLAVLVHASTALIISLHMALHHPRAMFLVCTAAAVAVIASGQTAALGLVLASRLTIYVDLLDVGQFTKLNIFSSMPLIQAFMLAAGLPHLRKLRGKGREEFAISCIGLASFYALSGIPVLAFRTYELLMPIFLILASKLWRHSLAVRIGVMILILSGLRTTFLGSGSLLFGGGS